MTSTMASTRASTTSPGVSDLHDHVGRVDAVGTRTRPTTALSWLIVVQGAALAVTFGVDTPPITSAIRALLVVTATAALVRSRPSTRGSVAQLALGLVGLVVGAGVGPQHAMVEIASAQAIGGLVTLVASVILTAVAATALVIRLRRWYRLPAVTVGIAVLSSLVLPATLAVFVTNPPDFSLGEATPKDYGFAYHDVTLTTSDDVDLAGWYVPSRNGGAVIVLGGATGARDAELAHGLALAEHGYGVLWLDVRGHGGSEGDAMLWGWWGEVDVRAGIDYLADRPDVRGGRIAAVGMSMGAEEAITAAGTDQRIAAVVAEGASARGARNEGDTSAGVSGLLVDYIDWATKNAAALMTSADKPTRLVDAAAAMHGRDLLLIAAGTVPAEVAAAAAIEAAAPTVVTTWVASNATHTKAYSLDPDEWTRRVTDFIDAALADTTPA